MRKATAKHEVIMFEKYEQFRFVKMIDNMMKCVKMRGMAASIIVEWLTENQLSIDLGMSVSTKHCLSNRSRSRSFVAEEIWKSIRVRVETRRKTLGSPRPSILEYNLRTLSKLFGLDEIEKGILSLSIAYQTSCVCESFFDAFSGNAEYNEIIAAALDVSISEIHERLSQKSRLLTCGIIEYCPSGRHINVILEIEKKVLHCLQMPRKSLAEFKKMLIGMPRTSELSWIDFEHIAERGLLERVLQGAVESRRPGINILFYGPPGTGKTEFCKVLARKAGLTLYAIGEASEDGGAPSRGQRFTALRMSQHLLEVSPRAILLFDEMEDLVESRLGPFEESHCRVHFHRLLETNARPVLWTCNHIKRFDPAILRRMIMTVEIKCPPAHIRVRVWSRLLAKEKVILAKEEIVALSKEFDAPPALAANAVRAAKLAGAEASVIRQLVGGVSKAMSGGIVKSPQIVKQSPFVPTIVNADTDVVFLIDKMTKTDMRNVSLCLSGPPGTGKSVFARHLADRMGIEVIQKRASELLSKWVGESEKAISAAFAQACAAEAMLIFDEADSLLADRRNAVRSWEVTQVNEMLTWMESHPYPFVCTSNLMERLDPASLRRFTFKLRFDYLGPSQAREAFRHFFRLDPPQGIDRLGILTPGDFNVVWRKAKVINVLADGQALLHLLSEECRAKKAPARRMIGFVPALTIAEENGSWSFRVFRG